MLKKIFLTITILLIIGFHVSVQAEPFPTIQYKSNLPSLDNFTSDEITRWLGKIFALVKHADIILTTNTNQYIKLLNIEKPAVLNEALVNEKMANLGLSSNQNFFPSNSAILSTIGILALHEQYLKPNININHDEFTVIAYNYKLLSNLYAEASRDLNSFNVHHAYMLEERNVLDTYKTMADSFDINAKIMNKIFEDMSSYAQANNIKIIVPSSIHTNMPKTLATLYSPELIREIDNFTIIKKEAQIALSQTEDLIKSGKVTDSKTKGMLHCNMGDYYMQQKDYEKAVEEYTIAINYLPTEAKCWKSRACAKHQLCDYLGTLYDINKAISLGLKKDLVGTYFIKGYSEVMLNQYNKAAESYLKVYQLGAGTSSLAAFAMTYRQAILNNKGESVKQKFLLENPKAMHIYLSNGNTFKMTSSPKQNAGNTNTAVTPIKKSVCPPGHKTYLIVGRLKGSNTEVRYATIAAPTKIRDITQADKRFSTVRYIPIPESEYNKYPKY